MATLAKTVRRKTAEPPSVTPTLATSRFPLAGRGTHSSKHYFRV
jgi:hypothetical protein